MVAPHPSPPPAPRRPSPNVLRRLRAVPGTLGAWARRIGHAIRPAAMDARVADEMRFHLDQLAARNVAAGMPPEDARRAALVAFGGRQRFREEARDAYGAPWLDAFRQDWRYAWRSIAHRRGVVATVGLTLALGVGAVATLFCVVNGVLLEPLPYPNAGRLVTIAQHWGGGPDQPGSISPAEYFDYVDQLRAFDAFGVYTTGTANLAAAGTPIQVPTAAVSGDVLRALGIQPALGRAIQPRDDQPGHDDVAMLSNELWTQQYGRSDAVIGTRILLDGRPTTIIGVLPPGFRLPDEMAAADPSAVLTPLALTREAVRIRGSHYLSSVALLRRGVSLRQGDADAAGVAARFVTRFPGDYPQAQHFGARAIDLRDAVVGAARPGLLLLLAAGVCVLLIATANAANLVLAQTETRRVELAVRTALGASASRLVRQLLVEGLALAALVAAGGVGLAKLGTAVLARLHPAQLPRLAGLTLDWRVVGFALLVALAATVASSVLPVLGLVRTASVQSIVRGGGRGLTAHRAQRRTRGALVAAEIAIAVVLVFGAGLLTLSFRRLLDVYPGFRIDHVLTAPVALPEGSFPSDDAVVGFMQQLTDQVSALPGVHAAGAVAGIPLVSQRGDIGIALEGRPVPPGAVHPKADWQVATPGYFRAIGMRLVRGRFLAPSDVASSPGVVVINEAMARRYWPGADPIGQRFTLGGGARPSPVTVVGVAGDVHQSGLASPAEPEMYLAESQFRFWGGGGSLRTMSLVINTAGPPQELAPLLRQTMRSLAPTVALGPMRTMATLRAASVAEPRFVMSAVATAGGLAFAIALIGVYGMMAYSVVQRRREFAMRVALGARGGDIIRLVVAEGGRLALAGAALGVPLALVFGRLLRRFLFGVTPGDPALLGLAAIGLVAVALAAAYLPARTAARADPMTTLRAD